MLFLRGTGVDFELAFEVFGERDEAFLREDCRGAEGGGGLLLALRAVAVVEGFGFITRRLEGDCAALAADVHCERRCVERNQLVRTSRLQLIWYEVDVDHVSLNRSQFCALTFVMS